MIFLDNLFGQSFGLNVLYFHVQKEFGIESETLKLNFVRKHLVCIANVQLALVAM